MTATFLLSAGLGAVLIVVLCVCQLLAGMALLFIQDRRDARTTDARNSETTTTTP